VPTKVSAAALITARALSKEYRLEVRPENALQGMTASDAHVAIVIDHATGVYKIAELRPSFCGGRRSCRPSAPRLPSWRAF
jgi:hypothetical protein